MQLRHQATLAQPLNCNAFCSITLQTGNTGWQQSCSHSNAICNHRVKKRIELRTQEQPLVEEHRGGTKTTPAATTTHTRYLSSPAAATLHGKTQGCIVMWCQVSHRPCHSLLFFCDVLLCDVKSHTALHQCQVSQFYLSVTRKYCFPFSFDDMSYSIIFSVVHFLCNSFCFVQRPIPSHAMDQIQWILACLWKPRMARTVWTSVPRWAAQI